MPLPEAIARFYPFTGHHFERNGLRMHYLDEGRGEPVVMLHGNPTWSIHYRQLVHELRSHYRVIVPDHIGMGLSDKPPGDRYGYRLADRIADLTALLERLDLDGKVTLIMHDWGGMIGMGYAARCPETIGRLVLLNTAAFHLPEDMKLPATIAFVRGSRLGALLNLRFNLFSVGASWACARRKPLSRALRAAYTAPYDNRQHRIGTQRFVEDIPLDPGDPSYQAVTEIERSLHLFDRVPRLFCWGDRDFVFTPRVLARWLERWPDAEVHRFADAGHYLLEDAGDEVTGCIRRFLQAHPLGSAAA